MLQLLAGDGATLAAARVLLLLELMYGGAMQSSWAYTIRTFKVESSGRLPRKGRAPKKGEGKHRTTAHPGAADAAAEGGQLLIHTPEQELRVALSARGMARVGDYLEHRKRALGRKRSGPFWVDAAGRAMTPAQLSREVKRAMERVGLPPRPSLLRQLSARHFAERGADTRSVRNLLRAKRLGSLDRYAPTSYQQVRAVFDQAHPRQEAWRGEDEHQPTTHSKPSPGDH